MFRRRFLSLAPQLAALAAAPAFIRTAHAQEGLSAKAVTIGSSGALSGPLAGFGADLKLGVEAAMGQINAKGGVNGRVLQFQMMDDGYVPQRTSDNVKKMIGDGSIFALMSCIGTPNNAAVVPLIEESNLPYVAPLTGASSLRKPGMRNVFHVRASYTDETQRLVQKLVGMGIKDLAIVYLDNGFGKEVLADALLALQAQGAKAAAQVALATDGKNLNEVVSQVSAARPGAVLLGTAGAASVGLIAALKKSSPMLPVAGLSVTLTADGLKGLGAAASGLALTMVFPDPYRAKSQVVRDYQAAMRAIGQQEFSLGSLESYVNTRVLAEGLERAGRDVTRAKLRTALGSVQKFDLGGFSVDYAAASPFVGSKFVDLGVLGAAGRFLG
ncbi:ABC transporter substrate-binding protein [Polaromonas sp. LjRoot131]|uniref:ABC transporter substrate-binding protein n=1 Tax=Polaromonas sp. LjRoot131 TaxID=3342262 RepID=UPI003ED0ACAE